MSETLQPRGNSSGRSDVCVVGSVDSHIALCLSHKSEVYIVVKIRLK